MQNSDKIIYFPQFQINSFWSFTFKSFCDGIKLFTTNLSDINLLIDWFINWLLSKANVKWGVFQIYSWRELKTSLQTMNQADLFGGLGLVFGV
jgi:hypothetical protein